MNKCFWFFDNFCIWNKIRDLCLACSTPQPPPKGEILRFAKNFSRPISPFGGRAPTSISPFGGRAPTSISPFGGRAPTSISPFGGGAPTSISPFGGGWGVEQREKQIFKNFLKSG